MTAPPPIFIRNGPHRRTFYTHGVPCRAERCVDPMILVTPWSDSRRILGRSYRDLRAFGLTASQARQAVVNLMLVPRTWELS